MYGKQGGRVQARPTTDGGPLSGNVSRLKLEYASFSLSFFVVTARMGFGSKARECKECGTLGLA